MISIRWGTDLVPIRVAQDLRDGQTKEGMYLAHRDDISVVGYSGSVLLSTTVIVWPYNSILMVWNNAYLKSRGPW